MAFASDILPVIPNDKHAPLIMRRLLHCLIVALAFTVCDGFTADYTAQPGPFAVGNLEQVWHDAARNRDVPVKIYYPKTDAGKESGRSPVIIFSHGLGGSREGYSYLGEHWASCGYI